MSYIDRINVQGTEYDVLDRRVRLADGQDFDYGTLVQGGINNNNGYTTGAHLRRSETYWPVIEGPANVIMQNGLTGYIRLYDADKTMIDPGEGMPGSDTTNHVLVIAKNTTMTLTMKEYNPNTAYFRFYFSCGSEEYVSALVRENARIVPLQTVATSGEMQMLGDDVSDLKSALNQVTDKTGIAVDKSDVALTTGRWISSNGKISSENNDYAYLPYYDISGYDVIQITLPVLMTTTGMFLAFYDGDQTYLSQVRCKNDTTLDANTYEEKTIEIPTSAKYIRTSWYSSTGQHAAMSGKFKFILTKNGTIDDIADSISELHQETSAAIKGLAFGGILVESFSVAENTAHSSSIDQIAFSIIEGDEFQICVYSQNQFVYRVFGFYNGSQTRIALDITANDVHTIISNGIYDHIGIFVAAQDTDYTATVAIKKSEEEEEEEGIESYYVEEMADTIEKVRAVNDAPSVVFPLVTDIHRYRANVQNFPQMINNIKYFTKNVKCDFIANLGDMIEGNKAKATSLEYAYDSTQDFANIGEDYIFALGNHDENTYTDDDASNQFTLAECYSAFFTATKNVVPNFSEYGTDYYFDLPVGVRVIVLNACNVSSGTTYAYGNSTAQWLGSVLTNTTTPVLLLEHLSSVAEQVWNNNNPIGSASINSVIQSFIDNGGKLIQMSGHSHADIAFIEPWLSIVQVCQKYEQADVSTTEYALISGYIDVINNPARTAQTYTEDAWSCCVYKPSTNDIYIIRFGAGNDRYFHAEPVGTGTLTSLLSGTLTWTSSDTSIATVSNGAVTAVGSGTCGILAKDTDGNYECWIVNVE